MRKVIAPIAIAVCAALAVAGCAGDGGQVGPGSGRSGQAGDSADSQPEAGSAAATAPEPAADATGLPETPVATEPQNPAVQFWEGSTAVDRNLIVPVADLAFLQETEQELVRRCMERQGFLYTPADFERFPVSGPLDEINLFWLQSLEQAEQWGYGGQSAFRNEDAPGGTQSFTDPNAEYFAQLSQQELDAWDEALKGTRDAGSELTEAEARLIEEAHMRGEYVEMPINTDGCFATTEAAIYGDLSRLNRLSFTIRGIRSDAKARVKAASAFVEAVAAWQACMQQQGYDFDDPWDAHDAVGAAYRYVPPYEPPTPEEATTLEEAMAIEAEIATADGRCAEDTGLFDVAENELARAVRDVMAEREGEILGYREMIATAVDNAKALLASS